MASVIWFLFVIGKVEKDDSALIKALIARMIPVSIPIWTNKRLTYCCSVWRIKYERSARSLFLFQIPSIIDDRALHHYPFQHLISTPCRTNAEVRSHQHGYLFPSGRKQAGCGAPTTTVRPITFSNSDGIWPNNFRPPSSTVHRPSLIINNNGWCGYNYRVHINLISS